MQVCDFGRGRRPRRFARKTLLASLKELLGPTVVQTVGKTLSTAQLGNAVLALQAIQRDPDLFPAEYCLRPSHDTAYRLPGNSTRGGCPIRPSHRGSAWFRVSVSSPLLGGCDVPETLSYQIDLNCHIGAGAKQSGPGHPRNVFSGFEELSRSREIQASSSILSGQHCKAFLLADQLPNRTSSLRTLC